MSNNINWGGAGAGAVGGATLGGLYGSIVPGIGTAVGAGAGMLLGAMGGGAAGTGEKAQGPGWQWLQNPEYPEVAPAMGTYWDYLAKGLENMQTGQEPEWWKKWRPLEESQRKAALYGTYYGKGAGAQGGNYFGPGVLATQRGADVAAGRRGAGGGSNYAKQLDMYAQGMSDIDDYLSKLGATAMDTAESRYLSAFPASQGIRGPAGQWGSYEGTAYQPSGMESMMQGVGSYLPYLGQTASLGSALGNQQQQQAGYGQYGQLNYGQQPMLSQAANDWGMSTVNRYSQPQTY